MNKDGNNIHSFLVIRTNLVSKIYVPVNGWLDFPKISVEPVLEFRRKEMLSLNYQ